jgi:hypothetical protein
VYYLSQDIRDRLSLRAVPSVVRQKLDEIWVTEVAIKDKGGR